MAETFGVVVAVGLTFFGLMLIAAQEGGITIGGGSQPDRMVLASANLGEVGGATTDIRTVNFGTFSIGEGRGEIQVYRDNRLELSNSLLSSDALTFRYNATQPTEAAVSFEVLGKRGNGALYVKVNGEKVFQEKLVVSATETIDIPGEYLESGVNTFKVGVTQGGIFSSTEYALEDFRATVTDRKFSDYRDSFQMYQYELKDFVAANLTFNIPADASVITQPLTVQVNNNNVFSTRTVRAEHSVAISRREAELQPGYNTITFETEGNASYKLENTQLTVRYIGITRSGERKIAFRLNGSRLDFVRRANTKERLSFKYQMMTGSNTLYLELEGFNRTISPVNGENTVSLPEKAFSRRNTLEIRSNGSFVMNDLKIISEVES
ncbi:MAG: hypothetical protein ABEJ36_04025 [Candidatus Nanosalina sp.]